MNWSRTLWAVWAVVPVCVLAYHFGPGQTFFSRDVAADLGRHAVKLHAEAEAAQQGAYAEHLKALEARKRAMATGAETDESAALAAGQKETQAFQAAADAWRKTAEALSRVEDVAKAASPETLRTVRWARSKALVRAGDIWTGASQLEDLITELDEAGQGGSEMATRTREELATAYYYGARLMRLSGEPPEEWLIESGKARQQFRYLAEQARAKGGSPQMVEDQRKNLELVLDLEQSSLADVRGKPLPRESPMGRPGNRPGNQSGKSKRPPQQRDGRGAGGAEEINSGW